MLKQTDNDFRKYFLLKFTKEIIKATETYRSQILKKHVQITIKENEKRPPINIYKTPPRAPIRNIVRNMIMQKVHRDTQSIKQMKKEPFENFFKPSSMKPRMPAVLKIPDLALPSTVQYLQPVPGQKEVDLGKVNPLISDPLVRTIECNGSNENIVVDGVMGRKETKIVLTKEEIDDIINNFSAASHIPAQEGFFKVAVGRLILSAIVSKVIGSKFIIRKMRDIGAPIPESLR